MLEIKSILTKYNELAKTGEKAALATVVKVTGSAYRRPGARMLVSEDGSTCGTISGGCLEADVAIRAQHTLETGEPLLLTYSTGNDDIVWGVGLGCGGTVEIRVERLLPLDKPELLEQLQKMAASAPHLLVCGAGHDAEPLVALAARLGWRATVVDARLAFAQKHRFPEAEAVICLNADSVVETLGLMEKESREWRAAAIMTHNYNHDLSFLRHLLSTDLAYIGLLGPKERSQKIYRQLESEGMTLSPSTLERVFAPAGLDIGSETPEEIALSILCEAQAVFSGRRGGSLRHYDGPIHGLPAESNETLPSAEEQALAKARLLRESVCRM